MVARSQGTLTLHLRVASSLPKLAGAQGWCTRVRLASCPEPAVALACLRGRAVLWQRACMLVVPSLSNLV